MQLHFREYGRGTPLVVLHGLFGSLDNWRTISEQLSPDFHVFAVDQRNHGRSPHSAEMNYPLMAGDLREFLDDHAIARAQVLGHSMGGKTAMQCALLYPSKVERLVVVDIAPRRYGPEHAPIFEALLGLDMRRFHSRPEVEAALAPGIPSVAVRRFLLKSLDRDSGGAFRWRFNLRGLQLNYDSLCGGVEDGAPFTGPALFVRGARSDYVGDAEEPAIRRLFPQATFAVIAGAGHWVHADAAADFVAIVRQFCAQEI